MLEHWVWLTTRKNLGTRGCAALLRRFGTAEAIYNMSKDDYEQLKDRRVAEALRDRSLSEANEILGVCKQKGIELLPYSDERYPIRLKNIADPPALLYYRGRLPEFDQEAVIAIVGSRRCSAYGLLQAKQFSKLIAMSGAIVISGGARGIDTMALRGALDSNMPVVCVLGCGLDIDYPRENGDLFRYIESHGCMLSEYPPGTAPHAGNFPVRNRIISGLSLGVLVVEAPEKSGALITANHALEQGRDVFAVPGNLGVPHCAGSNRLLREGAYMAENGWELLEQYTDRFPNLIDGRRKEAIQKLYRARFGYALPVYSPVTFTEKIDKKDVDNPPTKLYSDKKENSLSADETAALSVLKDQPIHIDELIAASGLPASRMTAALTLLQIKGLAAKRPGNYYLRF